MDWKLAELPGSGGYVLRTRSPVGGQSLVVYPGVNTGLTLFNLFTDNLDNEAECTLKNFVDNTKPGGVAERPDGSAAIHGDGNTLEKWNLEVQQREMSSPAAG